MSRRRRRIRSPRSCYWCGRQLEGPGSPSSVALTRDHVLPQSRGGVRTVPCCRTCNNLKGNMLPEEWRAFMVANPEWWRR